MPGTAELLEEHRRRVYRGFAAETAQLIGRGEAFRGRGSPREVYGLDGLRTYTEPAPEDVHVSVPLSNLAINIRSEGFVGDSLFPILPVQKDTDLYYFFNVGDWLRDEVQLREPTAYAHEAQYSVGTSNYNCIERAVAKIIPQSVLDNSDSALRPRQKGVQFVMDKMALGRENRIANQVTSTSNVGSGVALSGGTRWSQKGTSDPVSDVRTGIDFILTNTGKMPNVMVVGYQVHLALIDHPDILARLPNVNLQDQAAAAAALPRIFGVDRYLVGTGIINRAGRGATNSIVSIWGSNAVLAYVDPSPALDSVTAGFTFARFAARMRQGEDTRGKFIWIEGEEKTDERIVERNCIYNFTGVL